MTVGGGSSQWQQEDKKPDFLAPEPVLPAAVGRAASERHHAWRVFSNELTDNNQGGIFTLPMQGKPWADFVYISDCALIFRIIIGKN